MSKEMIMNLYDIQPSQLYVSSEKLEAVLSWFKPEDVNSYDPIPVKKLNNKIMSTDGHTRLYDAYLKGINQIKVYWDEDDLDWDAYQICVDWCNDENMTSIKDLDGRVISDEEYKVLWLERCRVMQQELEESRKNKNGGLSF